MLENRALLISDISPISNIIFFYNMLFLKRELSTQKGIYFYLFPYINKVLELCKVYGNYPKGSYNLIQKCIF